MEKISAQADNNILQFKNIDKSHYFYSQTYNVLLLVFENFFKFLYFFPYK